MCAGFILGMFMHVANLYVGLKNGGAIGVSITAAVMSWAIYRVFAIIAPKWFSEMSVCTCLDILDAPVR